MQEWQLTWKESRFLAEMAEITEATTISLAWAGGTNFTQPACLGIYILYIYNFLHVICKCVNLHMVYTPTRVSHMSRHCI